MPRTVLFLCTGNYYRSRFAEILFNRVWDADNAAVEINQDGVAGPIYFERNTIVGVVAVRNTDGADGPFYFRNNIIINNDPGNHLRYDNVSAPARVQITGDLVGTPGQNVVDANLNLTNSFLSYLGTHGSQISGTSASVTPPQNVRIIKP